MVEPENDMLAYPTGTTRRRRRRRRRQTPGPPFHCTAESCTDPDFEPARFEDIIFSQEDKDFCGDEETCLYDLVMTGDKEWALESRQDRIEDTEERKLISKSEDI